MTNYLRLKIPYLFICLLVYLFIAQTTNATSLSLSIDPPITVINAIPPTNVTSIINIQNKDDSQITLQIQIKPFRAKGENGELEYSRDSLEILKDIRVMDAGAPVKSITLEPKQKKELALNIDVPKNTNISDYYFSILFISTGSSSVESNSSQNQIGIVTNVLLSVGPMENSTAVLEEFSSGIFLEKGPVPFTVRVKNTGTHFIKPTGAITVKNMFGQTVGKLDLLNVNVLSGSIRAIPNDAYAESLSTDLKHPLTLWKESFLLGLYTATLNISLSEEGPIFTRTIYFFAFPFQSLIIIVIIAIMVIVTRSRLKIYMNKNRT